jgi:hypothetical protein
MTEYKRLRISGDYESVKLNVEGIEELVLNGKAEIQDVELTKRKQGMFGSKDTVYECLVKLQEEVNLSLKNVRIEEYREETVEVQEQNIAYLFNTSQNNECVIKTIEELTKNTQTPNKVKKTINIFHNYDEKKGKDHIIEGSYHAIGKLEGPEKSVLYLRNVIIHNQLGIKLVQDQIIRPDDAPQEKVDIPPEKPKSLND